MHLIRIAGLILAIGIILCASPLAGPIPVHTGKSSHPRASEYALKAAYIFDFIQFTDWPGKTRNTAISVLVAGDDKVRTAMESIATKANASGRMRLSIDPCSELACLDRPQVLYIGDDQKSHLRQWLKATNGLPVLTVSDIPGFADRGGMIELVRRQDRLSFRINRKAITDSGLYVSAQLLQLGEIIDGEHP